MSFYLVAPTARLSGRRTSAGLLSAPASPVSVRAARFTPEDPSGPKPTSPPPGSPPRLNEVPGARHGLCSQGSIPASRASPLRSLCLSVVLPQVDAT